MSIVRMSGIWMGFNGYGVQYRRLSAVCAEGLAPWPCDEGKKPPLCSFTPVSESESADLSFIHLVAAVGVVHSINDGIEPLRDYLDESKAA